MKLLSGKKLRFDSTNILICFYYFAKIDNVYISLRISQNQSENVSGGVGSVSATRTGKQATGA